MTLKASNTTGTIWGKRRKYSQKEVSVGDLSSFGGLSPGRESRSWQFSLEHKNRKSMLNFLILVRFIYEQYGEDVIFQQNNAPIHTSRLTKAWPNAMKVDLLPWIAQSPSKNSLQNLWWALARAVYCNGRQFSDKEELKECVVKEWYSLGSDRLKNLVNSMKTRCNDVVDAKEWKINC